MFVLNFQLMQHHKWSLTELENLIPWEREVYILQLEKWIEDENKKASKHRK